MLLLKYNFNSKIEIYEKWNWEHTFNNIIISSLFPTHTLYNSENTVYPSTVFSPPFIDWMTKVYTCRYLRILVTRKNLSLETPAGPEIRPISSSVINRAYRKTAKRGESLRRTARRTKNERLIEPRGTADSFKIPRWPCRAFCKAASCGRLRTTVWSR